LSEEPVEIVIGTMGSKDDPLLKTRGGSSKRYHCSNCKNNVHCVTGARKGRPVLMINDLCSNPHCMCLCRKYYEANNGKLRLIGTIDDTNTMDGWDEHPRGEIDDLVDRINAQNNAAKEKENV